MSLRNICYGVICRNVGLRSTFTNKFFSTESKDEIIDVTSADETPVYSYADDVEVQEEIAKKRNKSRLNPAHRNILMDLRPYDTPHEFYHHTVRYKKRMLGRYGLNATDVPAGFAWPTLEEIKDAQEYEKIAFPLSLQERWKKLEEERKQKAVATEKRQNEILAKLAKMDQWTAEMRAKVTKKEAELEKARLRKERTLEEIRRHFGFQISQHDERFKEMLAQKEKEEKKMKKEAKKNARIEKMTSMFTEVSKSSSQEEMTKKTDKDDKDPTKSTE